MASQALYRKWRSQTFDEIIGQQHVTQTLINALKLDRVAHAYLFAGPRGTGKTSTARLLAKAVNCLNEDLSNRPCNSCPICVAVNEGRLMDLIEIDAASNTGVDDIRDLRDKVGFRPAEAKIKFYIIDEVHMLSNSAFNALLKTLEEPPGHVIFVLATTEPEKIPATITSRCQRFDFKRIKLEDIVKRLDHIVTQEGFTAEPTALGFIARQAGGSMRDAISLLDQMVAYGGETISLELVQTILGVVASQSVIELVDALVDQNIAAGLDIINDVVSDGVDPRQFAREIVEYLRAVMLVKLGNGAETLNLPDETLIAIKNQASQIEAVTIVQATSRFNAAQIDVKSGLLAIPQLPLELAFVDAAMSEVAIPQPPVVAASGKTSVSSDSISSKTKTPPKLIISPPSSKIETMPTETSPVSGAGTTKFTIENVQNCLEHVFIDLEEGRTKDGKKGTLIAKALRYDAQLYKVSDNKIYFITSVMMKEKFERQQPKANIDDVFSRLLGQPVHVHFGLKNEVSTSTSSSVNVLATEGDGQDVDESTDALVKVATEELGGEIIE